MYIIAQIAMMEDFLGCGCNLFKLICGFILLWPIGCVIIKDHFFSVLQACYLRGLNSTHIAEERCRTWLGEWLQISCSLKGKTNPMVMPQKAKSFLYFILRLFWS